MSTHGIHSTGNTHTRIRPMIAIMVMNMLAFLPKARAYSWTKGWGASRAKRVSRSGVQKRKRMHVIKPKTPVARALDKMPLAATILWIDELNGMHVLLDDMNYWLRIFRFLSNVSRCIETSHRPSSKEAWKSMSVLLPLTFPATKEDSQR